MKTPTKNLLYLISNKKINNLIVIAALLLFLLPNIAIAVPKLQLYIPGAAYDTDTETWMYPGLEYDLWAIGADADATDNPYEIILDVKIAAAVKSGQDGIIKIQQYDSNGNLEAALTPSDKVFDSTPVKSDGKKLPPHDIYLSDFYEFELGNFVLDEQGIPDFTEGYDPDNSVPNNWGKIMKYHVSVTGYDWVHFDLYNHIEGDNHALFAPFSHDADAEDGGAPVPEPATMLLLGTGLIGLAGLGKKRFRM